MFPPQQSGFFINFDPHQKDPVQRDLILGQASLEVTNLTNKVEMGKNYKILSPAPENNDRNSNNNVLEKKILRKEIERLRRQHLSMLNASLRSLLPLESIKGKRSVCDHIDEAVKYIKYLERNIQDLSVKRNKLKNFSDLEALGQGDTSSGNCSLNCVSVGPYCGGVEIVLSCGLGEKNSLLSRVLEVVIEEGLDIVRCVSTRTDEGVFHTVQSEVDDPTSVDLHGLHKKLYHAIRSTQNISNSE